MNKKVWKTYAFWIILSEIVGFVAGFLTRGSTELYSQTIMKPPLSPPAIVFPIVWVILYALMGISAARVRLAPQSKQQQQTTNLFIAQLVVNFFWPLFFFNLQAFGFALLWLILLWVLVLLLIISSYRVDPLAAYLLIPYQIWLTFALYLNAGVWLLN
jgi:tryptophan-rich sensory protein